MFARFSRCFAQAKNGASTGVVCLVCGRLLSVGFFLAQAKGISESETDMPIVKGLVSGHSTRKQEYENGCKRVPFRLLLVKRV